MWSVPLVEKKARLMELSRLYASTPDTYIHKIIQVKSPICDETGKTITDEDGKPVKALVVRKSNANVKSRLLADIAAEQLDRRPKDEPDDDPENFARRVRLFIQQADDRTSPPPPDDSEQESEGSNAP